MTPDDFIRIRKQLGLSQAGLARLLGIKEDRTIRRWEAGEIAITGPAALCMRFLERYGPL